MLGQGHIYFSARRACENRNCPFHHDGLSLGEAKVSEMFRLQFEARRERVSQRAKRLFIAPGKVVFCEFRSARKSPVGKGRYGKLA